MSEYMQIFPGDYVVLFPLIGGEQAAAKVYPFRLQSTAGSIIRYTMLAKTSDGELTPVAMSVSKGGFSGSGDTGILVKTAANGPTPKEVAGPLEPSSLCCGGVYESVTLEIVYSPACCSITGIWTLPLNNLGFEDCTYVFGINPVKSVFFKLGNEDSNDRSGHIECNDRQGSGLGGGWRVQFQNGFRCGQLGLILGPGSGFSVKAGGGNCTSIWGLGTIISWNPA